MDIYNIWVNIAKQNPLQLKPKQKQKIINENVYY